MGSGVRKIKRVRQRRRGSWEGQPRPATVRSPPYSTSTLTAFETTAALASRASITWLPVVMGQRAV